MIKLNSNIKDLTLYLKDQNWLKQDETILSVEKPGDGNMNFTLRAYTDYRTFIIKQSREYVEKYPQFAAPSNRVLREAEFYELIQSESDLKEMTPNLIGLDKQNYVMLMEDLGKSSDYTFIYQKEKNSTKKDLNTVFGFASKLHNSINSSSASKRIINKSMRELNHQHIFKYPYLVDNGFDLNTILSGLQDEALILKQDSALKNEIEKLGELYLKDGNTLLHGDFFPGSWLKTSTGIKIIDPEFCFFGIPEFEIGVAIAHLKMAEQSEELIVNALEHYKKFSKLDTSLCEKFTAVEILRRIMGLAQLPLQIDLEKRIQLMEESRNILIK